MAVVRNMKMMTSVTLPEVIRMGRLTPAERAGIATEISSLEAGKRAEVLILDQDLNLQRVFIAGHEYQRTTVTSSEDAKS